MMDNRRQYRSTREEPSRRHSDYRYSRGDEQSRHQAAAWQQHYDQRQREQHSSRQRRDRQDSQHRLSRDAYEKQQLQQQQRQYKQERLSYTPPPLPTSTTTPPPVPQHRSKSQPPPPIPPPQHEQPSKENQQNCGSAQSRSVKSDKKMGEERPGPNLSNMATTVSYPTGASSCEMIGWHVANMDAKLNALYATMSEIYKDTAVLAGESVAAASNGIQELVDPDLFTMLQRENTSWDPSIMNEKVRQLVLVGSWIFHRTQTVVNRGCPPAQGLP